MQSRSVAILAAIIGFIYSGNTEAQVCTDKLLVPNVTINLTDNRSRSFLHAAMCAMTYDEFKQTYGADTGADYLGITGKGNFTSEKYTLKKDAECSDTTAEENRSALAYSSSSVVPPEARSAYVECMKAQELSCDFEPTAINGAAVINIYYHNDASQPTNITEVSLTNGKQILSQGSKEYRVGDPFIKGDHGIPIQVDSTPVTFLFEIKQNNLAKHCTAYLPSPAPPPPPPPQCKLLVIKAADFVNSQHIQVGALDVADYGTDIIHNGPPYTGAADMAEYRISSSCEGAFKLEVEYASGDSRPVSISLDDLMIAQAALSQPTGCFATRCQSWVLVGVVSLKRGDSLLRLSSTSVFPHIRTIRFTPVGQ